MMMLTMRAASTPSRRPVSRPVMKNPKSKVNSPGAWRSEGPERAVNGE